MRWLTVFLIGCAYGNTVRPYQPREVGAVTSKTAGGLLDERCFDPPAQLPRGIRHWRNRHMWTVMDPAHRGFDLIAAEGEPQVLRGKLAHSIFDKAIEDEDVTLFACVDHDWQRLGTARSDRDGRFELGVHLPVGMRDVYAAAPDGDDFRFLAYVAPRGMAMVVSDIDGTLTHGEGAFGKQLVFGSDVHAQPAAAASLRAATEAGYQIVYLSGRGDRFTDATRRWLDEQGFPRGPLRLGRPMLVMPGAATVEYKWTVVTALRQWFAVAAGVGNRASDVAAYRMAGLPAQRTFVVLPEFLRELRSDLEGRRAVGFTHYAPLPLPVR